jgi:hypothetical protein
VEATGKREYTHVSFITLSTIDLYVSLNVTTFYSSFVPQYFIAKNYKAEEKG